ncbi:MAG TPA: DUF805 domain-containing protein [Casimicrobiaceae bacterium]|nr:DUF805 domain-containing protein [Casimicrobiaceae bacterium]
MNWYLMALRKYADFGGRSRRSEYWYFVLFVVLIEIVLMGVERVLGLGSGSHGYGALSGLFALAMFIPHLAVGARRLHDTGRSGWWLLIGFVPIIGFIVLIVFFVQDGTPGSNAFGPNPKESPASA